VKEEQDAEGGQAGGGPDFCGTPLVSWWNNREENERAWRVPAAELLAAGCNLDRKNPRAKEDITHLPPEELAASILQKEQRIAEIMGKIRKLLAKHGA